MDLASPGTLKALMSAHGVRPQRRLGQNFLIETRVLDEIVAASGAGPEDLVLEIGPGLGTLTQRLAQAAGRVLAIEIDQRLIPILEKMFVPAHSNVEILHGDAGRIDLHEILQSRLKAGQRAKVAANLPYYITTPLVMKLLEDELPLDSIVVMVQKEVADRMISPPGSKEYGALSVAVQYHTEPRIVTPVSRMAFLPPPEVDSAVVELKVRSVPPVDAPPASFFKVVKAAFGQRRKSLLNALSHGLQLDKPLVQAALLQADVDPGRRGETLSLADFAAITRNLLVNNPSDSDEKSGTSTV